MLTAYSFLQIAGMDFSIQTSVIKDQCRLLPRWSVMRVPSQATPKHPLSHHKRVECSTIISDVFI